MVSVLHGVLYLVRLATLKAIGSWNTCGAMNFRVIMTELCSRFMLLYSSCDLIFSADTKPY